MWLFAICLHKKASLHILNVYSLDYTTVVGSGKVELVNLVNHTDRVDAVYFHSIDHSSSVVLATMYNRTPHYQYYSKQDINSIIAVQLMQLYSFEY